MHHLTPDLYPTSTPIPTNPAPTPDCHEGPETQPSFATALAEVFGARDAVLRWADDVEDADLSRVWDLEAILNHYVSPEVILDAVPTCSMVQIPTDLLETHFVRKYGLGPLRSDLLEWLETNSRGAWRHVECRRDDPSGVIGDATIRNYIVFEHQEEAVLFNLRWM